MTSGSPSAHGGASVDENERFTRDYKNLEVFRQTAAKDVLIVCHEEGTALGWRTWKLLETKPLRDWFNHSQRLFRESGEGRVCRSLLRQLARTWGTSSSGSL